MMLEALYVFASWFSRFFIASTKTFSRPREHCEEKS